MRLWHGLVLGVLAVTAGIWLTAGKLDAGEKKQDAGDKNGKELLKITGKITEDDPVDKVRPMKRFKVHEFKMEKGKAYRIDLVSNDFDSFLRLEMPAGKELAFDDDGGGFPHARLVWLADKTGDHRIIVTSFDGKVGEYTLTVVPASSSEVAMAKIGKFKTLSAEEKSQVLAELKKGFADKGKDLGPKEIQLAFVVGMNLENSDLKSAASAYEDFSKLFADATDEKAAKAAKSFEGAARRCKLMGQPIELKGKLLNGKELNWAKYKGKVVLVDFWATWCGPCVAELPNVKANYEKYHKRGFEVVGISLDKNAEKPMQFMKDKELPWKSTFDGFWDGPMATHYGIFSIPRAILVDREGKVVSMNARGPELGKLLEKLIGPEEKE